MNLLYYYTIGIIIVIISYYISRKIYLFKLAENNKSLNVIIIIFIFIFCISLYAVHLNRESKKLVKKIDPPVGPKGSKGIKGKKGKKVKKCDCDESICYKKVMSYITLVYNEWCVLKGLPQMNLNRQIRNKFIKQKVKMMCDSFTLKDLVLNNGSHRYPFYEFVDGFEKDLRPCNINKNCGAYDYLLNKWRQWILIILKYENGKYFLDSEDLTDVDFNTYGKDGMITPLDKRPDTAVTFKNNSGDSIWIFDNPLVFPISGDSPENVYNDVSFRNILKRKLVENDPVNGEASYNKLLQAMNNFKNLVNPSNTSASQNEIKQAYKNFNDLLSQYVVTLDYFISYFNKDAVLYKANKPLFSKEILYKSKFYNFYNTEGVPSATKNLLSPFDVIKKYDAWYWGANKDTLPKIEQTCDIDKISQDDSDMPKLKIKLSNTYNKLFDTKEIRQVKISTTEAGKRVDQYIPYKDGGDPNIDIFEADSYTDESGDLLFREYKPLGHVIVDSNYTKKSSNKCFPKIKNTNNPIEYKNSGPETPTLLVSGDVVPPSEFKRLFIRKRTEGADKNKLGYSYWRPIAPEGYMCLGDVISTNIDGSPPDKDSVRCIPKKCIKKTEYNDLKMIYSNKNLGENDNISGVSPNNITADSDYSEENNKTGDNYKYINTYTNQTDANMNNIDLDYKFVKFNNNNQLVVTQEETQNRFLKNNGLFRVLDENQNIEMSSSNETDNIDPAFYEIDPMCIYSEKTDIKSANIKPVWEPKLKDSIYSIMNVYKEN